MKINSLNNLGLSNATHIKFGAKPNKPQNPFGVVNDSFYSEYDTNIQILPPNSIQSEALKLQGKILLKKTPQIKAQAKEIKNNAQNALYTSKVIQEKANKLQFDALDYHKEAENLLKEAQENEFRTVSNQDYAAGWDRREYDRSGEGITITEYDDDDTCEVLRKVRITNDRIFYDDVRYFSGLVDRYIIDRKTKRMLFATLGKNLGLAGGYKAEEDYWFSENGTLDDYRQTYSTTRDADEYAKLYFSFSNNSLNEYKTEWTNGGIQHQICAKEIFKFNRGKIVQYDRENKDVTGAEKSCKQRFVFDERQRISNYIENLKQEIGGMVSASNIFNFKEGELEEIITGYETFMDSNIATAGKIYKTETPYLKLRTCEVNNKGIATDDFRIKQNKAQKIAKF